MTDLPDIKIKSIPQFPSSILGGTGIEATKENGHVVIDLAHGEFGTISAIPTSPTNTILTYDTSTGAYANIPSSLLGGAVAGISDAPIDGQLYGRRSSNWEVVPVNFIQAGTGAVTRTMQNKGRDVVHVRDFGAVCDGTTDDTAAIQSALNTGRQVHLPDHGTCKISGSLSIPTGGGLIGGGMYTTFLTSSSQTAPIIRLADGVGWVTIRDMCLTRSTTAVAGADGIQCIGTNQVVALSNMWIEKQWNGLSLSSTATSRASDMILHGNQNNGLLMVNSPTGAGYQWLLDNILSELNGGRGFLIASVASTIPGGNSTANMTRLSSFANDKEGFLVSGLSSVPINGIRLANCFFGEDGLDEVSLDSWGGQHVLNNVFCEIAGTRTTGPGISTPASHVGSGFLISPHNSDVEIVGCRANGNSRLGLWSLGGDVGIVGGSFTFNGTGTGSAPGIYIQGGSARIVGVRSGGAPQNYGVVLDNGPIPAIINGCDLRDNTTGDISNNSSSTVRIGNNLP